MSSMIKKCGQKVKKILIELGQSEDYLDDKAPPQKPEMGEFLTQRGAMALAKRLEHYWHQKGYHAARFWAEPIGERFEKVGTYEIYRVTSNLVNGIPPRYALNYAPTTFSTLPAY
ncbi:MAG: hypothetical protein K2Q32_04650 [Alphaproteobacteria bacterium]|nr:hypothetical protein [Alphaproteobacteria bacterium]